MVGGWFTVMCEAVGRPEPTYTIIYNDERTVSTRKTYNKSHGVGLDDAGIYVCNATNSLGNDLETYTLVIGM